jgi:hypothetical protein
MGSQKRLEVDINNSLGMMNNMCHSQVSCSSKTDQNKSLTSPSRMCHAAHPTRAKVALELPFWEQYSGLDLKPPSSRSLLLLNLGS